MEYAVGIALALIVVGFARVTGFDGDRAFYPVLVIVVASYYVLFATIGGSGQALIVESTVMAVFVLLAIIGFRLNLWFAVAGLGGHGVFDALHDVLTTNPGVPEYWPAFCMTFDLGAAGLLAWLLVRSRLEARPNFQ